MERNCRQQCEMYKVDVWMVNEGELLRKWREKAPFSTVFESGEVDKLAAFSYRCADS